MSTHMATNLNIHEVITTWSCGLRYKWARVSIDLLFSIFSGLIFRTIIHIFKLFTRISRCTKDVFIYLRHN